jgi:hypothetical protein
MNHAGSADRSSVESSALTRDALVLAVALTILVLCSWPTGYALLGPGDVAWALLP